MELFGRKTIYTDVDEITRENVIGVLQKAIILHITNVGQINRLYDYYRGKQDILYRKKEVRPEICSKIVENRAKEIVDFKTGMVGGKPIKYIARKTTDNSEAISVLNELMAEESKATKDKELIEWAMIAGTCYRYVAPLDESHPFETFTLDPREAFCIYSSKIGKKKMAGVYVSVNADHKITYTVYTETKCFEIVDNKITKESPYVLGIIPIIEYPMNRARLGAFEPVITILDAINDLDSNRLDGVKQFVQSLIVATNCNFKDGEDANAIRQNGMVCIKSLGENKAEIKILTEELDQSQTQTLKDDLYDTVLTICAMPNRNGSGGGTSDNGIAVVYRDGWSNAETDAQNYEAMFKRSEREFLALVLRICESLYPINVEAKDIDITFTRGNYENMQSKSQVLTTMLNNDKIDPKLAFECCGIFTDPQSAYASSMEWYEKQRELDVEQLEEKTEEEVEEDDDRVED